MSIRSLIAAMILSTTVSGFAMAQAERPERGERGERFQRGERGERFDPQQIRQRMDEQLKQQLGATDLEWEVLQPKIERVTTAQRNVTVGRIGGLAMAMGPGGGRGVAARGGDSEVAVATRELRTVLQNEDASEQEIAQRLEAFRAARKKAGEELEAAQEDLRDVLTERQEAVLVMMGLLE